MWRVCTYKVSKYSAFVLIHNLMIVWHPLYELHDKIIYNLQVDFSMYTEHYIIILTPAKASPPTTAKPTPQHGELSTPVHITPKHTHTHTPTDATPSSLYATCRNHVLRQVQEIRFRLTRISRNDISIYVTFCWDCRIWRQLGFFPYWPSEVATCPFMNSCPIVLVWYRRKNCTDIFTEYSSGFTLLLL